MARGPEGRRMPWNSELPEPGIPVAGFPLCKGLMNTCDMEVQKRGNLCPEHGGPPITPEILQRTYLRQLRTSVEKVLRCSECEAKDPFARRCLECAFHLGAAWALGGLMERHGWKELSAPFMALVFRRA
jgi:hypothetical protein